MIKKRYMILALVLIFQGNVFANSLEKEVNLLRIGFELLVKKVTELEDKMVKITEDKKPVIEITEVTPRNKPTKRSKRNLVKRK